MQTEYALMFKDAEGRRPYLPHDHRHTGHRPTREGVASTLWYYRPGRNEAHDEVVDRVLETGARFGLDIHTPPPLIAHLPMALIGAAMTEAIDRLRPSDIPDPTDEEVADMERMEKRQINSLGMTVNTVDQIRDLTESMALNNHFDWIMRAPENQTTEGLARALARSRLSLEDVNGRNRHRLERRIGDMERLLSGC